MLSALSFILISQSLGQIEASLSNKDQVVLPAVRLGNYLQVKAMVNGKPLRLIVDTGAGLNVLTWEAAKLVGAENGQDIQASGAGADRPKAKLVKINDFRLGDASVKGDMAVVLALPEMLNCDGLVGYSFLRHFATTFDYDENQLIIHKTGTYKPSPAELTGELQVRNNHPTVKGQIAGEKGWMLIDTGNNGTTSILKWLVTKANLVKTWPTSSERVVGRGVGGDIKGYVSISPGFQVSGVSLPKGQVTLDSSGVAAFGDPGILANVGAEHIRRLRMTLDYSAGKAFFGKSKAFDSPLMVDRSGVRIEFTNGNHSVVGVVKDSPGDRAGVKVGDKVLEINGKRAEESEPLLFALGLRQQPGTDVAMKLERGGNVVSVSFKLEDLIK